MPHIWSSGEVCRASRLLRLGLAFLVEAFLLAGIWLWVNALETRPEGTIITARSLAYVNLQPLFPTVQSPVQVRSHIQSHQLPVVTRPILPDVVQPLGVLQAQLGHISEPQVGTLLQWLPRAPHGLVGGSLGQGLWVDIPIPGSGGLPLSGYRVIQTRFYCGTSLHHRGYLWVEGRVDDSGRIVSDKVLMSDLDPHDIFKGVQYIRRWKFMPLRVDRRAIWFRIVVAAYATLYRVHHLHRPLYQSETRCNPPMLGERHWQFNGVMPHWVLYRLAGHHPLAVLLAYGHEPDPDAAQAVALYLSSLVGRHHE